MAEEIPPQKDRIKVRRRSGSAAEEPDDNTRQQPPPPRLITAEHQREENDQRWPKVIHDTELNHNFAGRRAGKGEKIHDFVGYEKSGEAKDIAAGF
ncbi:MAG: hypothetical protein N3A66_04070 [Planctomycetota bacterium]|nr:hypothetical protein [Planctomycetota bacterium]